MRRGTPINVSKRKIFFCLGIGLITTFLNMKNINHTRIQENPVHLDSTHTVAKSDLNIKKDLWKIEGDPDNRR